MFSFEQQLKDLGYCVINIAGHQLKVSDAFNHTTMFVMCFKGSVNLEINMEKLNLEEGMCLIYTNLQFLNCISISPDFRARALFVNDKLALSSTAGIKGAVMRTLIASPASRIVNPEAWELLGSLLHSTELYSKLPTSHHIRDVVGSLLRSIVVILGETVQPADALSPSTSTHNKADTYFRKFISLINDNVQDEHEVAFYASSLNISPKYLSEICKNKSGRKAKEMISIILANQIKRDILESGDSIKGLAYKYGFADQSSLGKFFRKMTGLSPIKYQQTAR